MVFKVGSLMLGIASHFQRAFLILGPACAISLLAGQTAVAGFVANATAYIQSRADGEEFFSNAGYPANIEGANSVNYFHVTVSPGEVKVFLEGGAISHGPAVSGTGLASGSASDFLHFAFFASQIYHGHILSIEQLYRNFYPVIAIAVEGTLKREESSAAAQANGAFQADVFFGGTHEDLFDYDTRLILDRSIDKDLGIYGLIRGEQANSYGPAGVPLRIVYSAQNSIIAFGPNESASIRMNFYNTMKVVGFGMVDADGNYAPTSFYTLTTDSELEIPRIGPQAAPEPGTLTLVGIGAFGLFANTVRRRRRAKPAA